MKPRFIRNIYNQIGSRKQWILLLPLHIVYPILTSTYPKPIKYVILFSSSLIRVNY